MILSIYTTVIFTLCLYYILFTKGVFGILQDVLYPDNITALIALTVCVVIFLYDKLGIELKFWLNIDILYVMNSM